MTDTFKLPCNCKDDFGPNDYIVVQYRGDQPGAWDGFSEYRCNHCNKRFGRWSMRELIGDDYEDRHWRVHL